MWMIAPVKANLHFLVGYVCNDSRVWVFSFPTLREAAYAVNYLNGGVERYPIDWEKVKVL